MKLEFHIADYHVDIKKGQITNTLDNSGSASVNISQKSVEVLSMLVDSAPNVITVEDIIAQVWPKADVNAGTVQRCISQLRKAFGDNSKLQKVIKTHPKKGYSLAAPISEKTKAPEASPVDDTTSTTIEESVKQDVITPTESSVPPQTTPTAEPEVIAEPEKSGLEEPKVPVEEFKSTSAEQVTNDTQGHTEADAEQVNSESSEVDTTQPTDQTKQAASSDTIAEDPKPAVHSLQGHPDEKPHQQSEIAKFVRSKLFVVLVVLVILIAIFG